MRRLRQYARIGVAAALLLSPMSGAAQTAIEAAASNATLAMKLCLLNYQQPQALLEQFQKAGFSYSPEDFGGGNVLHWFASPAGHVQTAVAVNGISVECRVGTDLWGVEAMLPFAQAAFAKLARGITVHPGGPEGQNILPGTPAAQVDACSGFNVFLPRTLLWVQIERQGNDGSCISDGTSVMRMRF